MTATHAKWFIPGIGALTVAFWVGVWVARVPDAHAFVPRSEYERHLSDERIQHLSDSLHVEAKHSEEIQRLDQLTRIVYKLACHQFPMECEK